MKTAPAFDEVGIELDLVKCHAEMVGSGGQGWEQAIGKAPLSQGVPNVFGRIQLRAVGKQDQAIHDPIHGAYRCEGVPATISVRHYSGEHLFKTPDEFIHNALNSIVRINYQHESTVADVKIAGRSGKQFHIETFELVYLPQFGKPPRREGVVYEIVPPHKQVDMMEQYTVVPAGQGYFVLGYRSPIKMVEENQELFRRVIESFLPQVP